MVYCRSLPHLTFPVTEWDLGARLFNPQKEKNLGTHVAQSLLVFFSVHIPLALSFRVCSSAKGFSIKSLNTKRKDNVIVTKITWSNFKYHRIEEAPHYPILYTSLPIRPLKFALPSVHINHINFTSFRRLIATPSSSGLFPCFCNSLHNETNSPSLNGSSHLILSNSTGSVQHSGTIASFLATFCFGEIMNNLFCDHRHNDKPQANCAESALFWTN